MHRYAYDNCPVCGLNFSENDDIVVCPVCGTPHHRDCYNNAGHCANEDKHDDGFSYVLSAPAAQKNNKENTTKNSSFEQSSSNETPPPGAFENSFTISITDGEEIDGVPVGDLKKFIGSAWMYYIPLFLAKIKGAQIFRINFSAFIGSYIWLFARKFYLLGFLSSIITLISYLYSSLYLAYIDYSGIKVTELTEAILRNKDPILTAGYYIYIIVANIPFVLSLLLGIFANTLYMKRCVKKVKKINKVSTTAEEFNTKLTKKGGINSIALSLSLGLTFCYNILEQREIIHDLMIKFINYLF